MFLKVVSRIAGYFRTLVCSWQVAKLGNHCRVMEGVVLNGGKNILIGDRVYIGRNVLLDASGGLIIGDGVEIRDNARIYARNISIGDDVTVGEGAFLNGDITVSAGAWIARSCDLSGTVVIQQAILGPHVTCLGGGDHARDPKTGAVLMSDRGLKNSRTSEDHKPVRILDGAWVGHGAILLKDVTVFQNAVVGAGSVVTKDVVEGAVVAGNPAKLIASKLSLGH